MAKAIAESDDPAERRASQEQTRQALAGGKLPPRAVHRLKRLAHEHDAHGFFMADLEPREYLLAREAGYETLGVVMGTAVFKLGLAARWLAFRGNGELTALTHAETEVRRLALVRLRREAAVLGAHGVIGVRIQLAKPLADDSLLEYMAVGTAIRVPGRPPLADGEVPFTSDLSGQEFWAMHAKGHWPKGLAYGICSYYLPDGVFNRIRAYGFTGLWNRESPVHTAAFTTARELAMQRLTKHALHLGATHVLGGEMGYATQVYPAGNNYNNVILTFLARGTALVSEEQPAATGERKPLMMLDLATGTRSRLDPQRTR